MSNNAQQQKPLVSVVTVCRNALPALQKTAESVAAQTYPEVEYIVVDGASHDGTAQWLHAQASRLARYVSEPDGGIFDAMNKGVRMARGEWVCFMNAGDVFANSGVLQRVFAVAATEQADVIYGDVVKNGRVKVAERPHNAHRMFFCHQSALVRTTCLRQFPFDTRLRMSADLKQMKQLFLSGKHFLQLSFPVAVFDTEGVSNTRRSDGLKENMRVVRELDTLPTQLRLLPRLWLTYLVCRIRGK